MRCLTAPNPSFARRLASWLCLAMLAAAAAHGATRVEVLETYPADTRVTLAQGQSFYLRLHYDTDVPVQIWARPFFKGKPAQAGSNPSYPHAGSGEALGWFFLMDERAAVDEIRVMTGDGSNGGTTLALTYPVQIVAGPASGTREAAPDWVARLQAVDAEQQRRAREEYASQSGSGGSGLFMSLFMLTVLALGLAGIVLPIRALFRWRGGWRMAAAVPAALMGFVVLRIMVGVAIDPTSHNLWPFEILTVGFLGVVIMAVLMLVRRTAKARET